MVDDTDYGQMMKDLIAGNTKQQAQYQTQYTDIMNQLSGALPAQQKAYQTELDKQKGIDIANLRGVYEQSGLANAGQMFKTIGTDIQPEYAGKAAKYYADMTQQNLQTKMSGVGNLMSMGQNTYQNNLDALKLGMGIQKEEEATDQTNFDNILNQQNQNLPYASRFQAAQDAYKTQYGGYFGDYAGTPTDEGGGDEGTIDAPISEDLIGNDGVIGMDITLSDGKVLFNGKEYTSDQMINSYLKAEGYVDTDISSLTTTEKLSSIANKYGISAGLLDTPQELMEFAQGKVTVGVGIDENDAGVFQDTYTNADKDNEKSADMVILAREDLAILDKAYAEVDTGVYGKMKVPIGTKGSTVIVQRPDGSYKRMTAEQYTTAKAAAEKVSREGSKLEAELTAGKAGMTKLTNGKWVTKDEWKALQNTKYTSISEYIRPSYLI